MVSIDILPGVNQFFFIRYPSLGIQVGGVSILPLSNRFLVSHAKSSLDRPTAFKLPHLQGMGSLLDQCYIPWPLPQC
jgi:hypothetical protein